MPITKAAKKALRQNKRRKVMNVKKVKQLRTALKEARVLISQNKNKELQTLLPKIYKALDKSAKIGLIKKNQASRKKSRITKAASRSK